MDKDTLQILIMVAGFAITIITGLLRFPSRAEMNQQLNDTNKRFDDVNQRITDLNQQFNERIADLNQRFDDMNKRFDDMNQRLIDLSADVRNIYHILIQGKLGESEKDD